MATRAASTSSEEQRFKVFKVQYHLAMPDPDVSGPRYHSVLFVESRQDQKGHMRHVTGDLISGMHYESQPADRAEDDNTRSFFNKELLGSVAVSGYVTAFDDICTAQPTPPKQKAFNSGTIATEPIKPDGSFYGPGEARRPLFKCPEWIEDYAIAALIQVEIIK